MNPTITSSIAFVCVFGGALLGMLLRQVMPEHHLNDDSKDVIKLGVGLIATVTALVLGLVIATAKSSYDMQDEALKHASTKIILLDRVLDQYGPEASEARALIKSTLAHRLDQIWPEERSLTEAPILSDTVRTFKNSSIERKIRQLSPQNETQRGIQIRALQIGGEIMETRWFVMGTMDSSIPVPFLVIVVFWLTIIFVSFGLLAPRNTTVIVVLFVCALSVSCAILLILEMAQPFSGFMKISSAPLRFTLSHLGL